MNLTFIGMSGAGKSLVGKAVADRLGWYFYDVDREMERECEKSLQEILDGLGDEEFLREQAQQVIGLGEINEYVIAPGGSVVYTVDAMKYLMRVSTMVYIKVSCDVAKSRLVVSNRGIVGLKDKTYEELFAEREVLYEKYADVVIEAGEKSIDEIADEVMAVVK